MHGLIPRGREVVLVDRQDERSLVVDGQRYAEVLWLNIPGTVACGVPVDEDLSANADAFVDQESDFGREIEEAKGH